MKEVIAVVLMALIYATAVAMVYVNLKRFMPGCTHAGVPKGSTCPLCGRTV